MAITMAMLLKLLVLKLRGCSPAETPAWISTKFSACLGYFLLYEKLLIIDECFL